MEKTGLWAWCGWMASVPGPQETGLGKPGLAGCPIVWLGEALPCLLGI